MFGFVAKYSVLALLLIFGDGPSHADGPEPETQYSDWFNGTYALAPSICESHPIEISRIKILAPRGQLFSDANKVYAVSNDRLIHGNGAETPAVTILLKLEDNRFRSLYLATITEAMADAVDMPYMDGMLLYFFFTSDEVPVDDEITRRMQSRDVDDYGVLFSCTPNESVF